MRTVHFRLALFSNLVWISAALGQQAAFPEGLEPADCLPLLVNHPEVQKELVATSEQLVRAKAFFEKAIQTGTTPSDLRKDLANILKPEQLRRLREISIQSQGGWSLGQKEVADELELTGQQHSEIGTVRRQTEERLREDLQRIKFRSEQDRWAYVVKRHQAAGEAMRNILTGPQATKFAALQGDKFPIERLFPSGQ
jgi:hypothetical protein